MLGLFSWSLISIVIVMTTNFVRIVHPSGFFYLDSSGSAFSVATSSAQRIIVSPTFKDFFFVNRSLVGSVFSFYNTSFHSLFGYYSVLHVKGIGFKVFYYKTGHSLYFLLGYNHLLKFELSASIYVKVRKQYILLFSGNKEQLGRAIYAIQHLRFPDPYRGKGIRFRFQVIKFKPGKQR